MGLGVTKTYKNDTYQIGPYIGHYIALAIVPSWGEQLVSPSQMPAGSPPQAVTVLVAPVLAP